MEKINVWTESKKMAEDRIEVARADIFAACYSKNEKSMIEAVDEWKAATRAAEGWREFIAMDAAEVLAMAKSKAGAACVYWAGRLGKNPADVLQYRDDAAQEAALAIYSMEAPRGDYGPASIMAYEARKYVSSAIYNGQGRNGREDRIEAGSVDTFDGYLFNNNTFGKSAEAVTLARENRNDRIEAALAKIKPSRRAEAAQVIRLLACGRNQSEIAQKMNCTQSKISKLLKMIRNSTEK